MKIIQSLCLFVSASIACAQQPLSLEQALASARSKRPSFESATLRLAQARLSSRALGAPSATRLFIGYSSIPETGGSDNDLVLSQPIDLFGRSSAGRRAGHALVAQAEAAYRKVSSEIQEEVVQTYLEAATATELARSAQEIQSVYVRLHEATKLRVEGGVEPGFHLTRVSLELEQARLRTEQRRTEARSSLERLQSVTGADNLPAVQAGFPDLTTGEPDQNSLATERADLLALTSDVLAAEAEVSVARAAGMPELELQGRRTPWQDSESRFGLRLQLSIPLFDHGRAKAEAGAASRKAEAARKTLADATKLALGEVQATRIEVDAAKLQVGEYKALVERAIELVERLRPGLTEQATTLIEVLDATRTLRDLEQAHVEAQARLALAQARHLKATGRLIEVSR